MTRLSGEAPALRDDRPATRLLHDETNARVVAFHLQEGQSVPPHRSDSTVIVQVIAGDGVFRGEGGEARLAAGDTAVYAPGEMHSMDAMAGPLHFLAILTPRPG